MRPRLLAKSSIVDLQWSIKRPFYEVIMLVQFSPFSLFCQINMYLTAPASSITFQQERSPTGQQVNVSCSAKNIYPQPQIKLTKGLL